MRSTVVACLALSLVLGLTGMWSVTAQTRAGAGAKGTPEEEVKEYIVVAPNTLNLHPADFEGRYVQLPDLFDEQVAQNKFPSDVKRYGITPRTHFGFTTDRADGSNMICFVSRENKEAQEFFKTPLPEGTQIYLMGRVGPKLVTDYGIVALMQVDRVVRGTTPPAQQAEEQRKSISFTMEWQTETGMRSQKYEIPVAGKKYIIPDPYDPARKLYMTFDF